MRPDRGEILRYLRMGAVRPDAALSARIDALERDVLAAAEPKHLSMIVPVTYGESAYTVGPLELASRDLRRTLGGARKACLFAATLGHGVDRLLRRAAVTGADDLLICQAVAAAAIEGYIDEVERSLPEPRTPRFSPGYGDLPLDVQRGFLAAIDAPKRLGITLTDTLLMIPSKSVTAIIGVLS